VQINKRLPSQKNTIATATRAYDLNIGSPLKICIFDSISPISYTRGVYVLRISYMAQKQVSNKLSYNVSIALLCLLSLSLSSVATFQQSTHGRTGSHLAAILYTFSCSTLIGFRCAIVFRV